MNTPLQQAAQAVIDRWDSPSWKDEPPTAVVIGALRKALADEQTQAVEPVGVVTFLPGSVRPILSRLPGARLNSGDKLFTHPAGEPVCPDCHAPGLLYECAHCSASNYPAPPPAEHLSEILAEKGLNLRTEFEPKPLPRRHDYAAFKAECEREKANPLDERAELIACLLEKYHEEIGVLK